MSQLTPDEGSTPLIPPAAPTPPPLEESQFSPGKFREQRDLAHGVKPLPLLALPMAPARKTDEELRAIEVYANAKDAIAFVVNLALVKPPPAETTAEEAQNVAFRPKGIGSGVIVNLPAAAGIVLTNIHVIEGADKLSVRLGDGSMCDAKVLGSVEELDLAVLRLIDPPENLASIPFGDSSQLEVGQRVFAVGNPFGLERTLTTGVVSSIRDHIKHPNGQRIPGLIQTDAAINPGNSGGALLDGEGRLIGINTFIMSPSGGSAGIGFAVPMNSITINSIKQVLPQIVHFGWLLDESDRGLLVRKIFPGGVADSLGIQAAEQVKKPPLLLRPFMNDKTVVDYDHAFRVRGINGKTIRTIAELNLALTQSLVEGRSAMEMLFSTGLSTSLKKTAQLS